MINGSMDQGTQLPYIREAKESGYAVLVLNTNDNKAGVDVSVLDEGAIVHQLGDSMSKIILVLPYCGCSSKQREGHVDNTNPDRTI